MVILVLCVAALCACETSSQDGVAARECFSPGVSADRVNLGLVLTDSDNTASAAVFRAYRAGIEARIALANAEGGVDDRRITYSWEDDHGSRKLNLDAARSLVESQNVFGVMQASAVASGSAEFLSNRGIPVVGIGIEREWAAYPNMFTHSFTAAQGSSVTTWGEFVRERGGRRAVILQSALNDASISTAAQLGDSLRSVGVSVVDTVTLTPGFTNQNALVERIRESRADTVVGTLDGDSFGQTVVSVRSAGIPVVLFLSVPPGYSQNTLRTFGAGIAGMVAFAHFAPFELGLAANQRLVRALESYAPYLQPPNQSGAGDGWIIADMFLRGLKLGGECPTRENFIAGLRQVKDYNADGLLASPIDLGSQLAVNPCWFFVQVSADGSRFEPIGTSARCGQPIQGTGTRTGAS